MIGIIAANMCAMMKIEQICVLVQTIWQCGARQGNNAAYHEARQGWKHVDGWVDLSVVKLAVHIHLALSDVACQVWDGMSDVIIGHGEDGQLRDGALTALNTPCPLVDGGQISVHVSCQFSTCQ